MPTWSNVKLILFREVRDQLRDRRTLFTIAILPLFLYPLLGMTVLQVSQFMRGKPVTIRVVGAANLPSEPQLLVKDKETGGYSFSSLFSPFESPEAMRLDVHEDLPADWTEENIDKEVQALVANHQCEAVLYIPKHFAENLAEQRKEFADYQAGKIDGTTLKEGLLGPKAIADSTQEKSVAAANRVRRILEDWVRAIGNENLENSKLPAIAVTPVIIPSVKEPTTSHRQAMVWSKILPFVALIWALTGAFYPAVDLCAGEKERGTLETLLSSPALRSEIVFGKLLTIMAFSITTSLLNLLSLTITGAFIIGHMDPSGSGAMPMGSPPLASLGWLALTLVPVSALFSALSLAIASFARSSKEGQYYLMPLLLVCLPLMMLPMPADAELTLGTSLIPVTGVMLLLRTLIEGQYATAMIYAGPVVLVTLACCMAAIRWSIVQFNRESVLFRDGEQWSMGLWLQHFIRNREATPTAGMAILAGVLLLLIRFFAMFLLGGKAPTEWSGFVTSTLIMQIGLIVVPMIFLSRLLISNFRETFSLKMPHPLAIPGAILLAIVLHPTCMLMAEAVNDIYAMNEGILKQLKELQKVLEQAPNLWALLGVVALAPAICEEMACRGFILSGLRRSGQKWMAILISSLIFGVLHFVLQQSITAGLLGVVLGYLTVQTGSIFPSVGFHLAYNSLSMIRSFSIPNWINDYPILNIFYVKYSEGHYNYNPTFAIAGFAVGVGLLYWFHSLPYQATTEEKFQQIMDHQSLPVPTK